MRSTIPAGSYESPGTAPGRVAGSVGPQALIWFTIAGGAVALALSLLYARYVRRDASAVRSRGGATLFAVFMLLFAAGAAAAGFVAVKAGR